MTAISHRHLINSRAAANVQEVQACEGLERGGAGYEGMEARTGASTEEVVRGEPQCAAPG